MKPYEFGDMPSNAAVSSLVTVLVSAWFVIASGAILTDQHSEANIERAKTPTERLHHAFFAAIDEPLEHEDPSDRLLDVESQLVWLREIGVDDVDCYWKWLEMALLIGIKSDR